MRPRQKGESVSCCAGWPATPSMMAGADCVSRHNHCPSGEPRPGFHPCVGRVDECSALSLRIYLGPFGGACDIGGNGARAAAFHPHSNPAAYVCMMVEFSIITVASMINLRKGFALDRFAGVIFSRANSSFSTVESLRKATAALGATSPPRVREHARDFESGMMSMSLTCHRMAPGMTGSVLGFMGWLLFTWRSTSTFAAGTEHNCLEL